MCWTFVAYVIALDIAAVAYRDHHVMPTSEFFTTTVDDLLYQYPLMLLAAWDMFALFFISLFTALLILSYKFSCCDSPVLPPIRYYKHQYLLMILFGIAPLLCLASHTHYIAIAWITDPVYSGSIGIYYGIFIFVWFFLLKQTHVKYCFGKTVTQMSIAWLAIIAFQVLISVFFVHIPIKHSIENTPTFLYAFISGTGALLLFLIAYKVIQDPRGTLSISEAIAQLMHKQGQLNTLEQLKRVVELVKQVIVKLKRAVNQLNSKITGYNPQDRERRKVKIAVKPLQQAVELSIQAVQQLEQVVMLLKQALEQRQPQAVEQRQPQAVEQRQPQAVQQLEQVVEEGRPQGIEQLKQKITNIEQAFEELQEEVRELKQALERFDHHHSKQVKPVKQAVESLKQAVKNSKKAVEQLKEAVEQGLLQAIAQLNQTVETLRQVVPDEQLHIEPFDQEDDIDTLIGVLNKAVTPLKKAVKQLKQAVEKEHQNMHDHV